MSATAHLHSSTGRRAGLVLLIAMLGATLAPRTAQASYGWPVKPFDRQHPIRGFFGDPRISDVRGDITGQLHFGIDVSAADGTAVYATLSGWASVDPYHPDVVDIVSGSTTFSYWHVVPAIHAQAVAAERTVIGHVEAPWAHVHFSELQGGVYVNPLRPGALSPYADHTRPAIHALCFERHGTPAGHTVSGRVDLVAEVADTTPLAVPGRWLGMPVMPALVRYRILGRHGAVIPWRTAFDVRERLPSTPVADVFAPWTRMNHAWRGGRYRVYLVRGWNTTTLPDGGYRLEAMAADTRGNETQAEAAFTILNRAT
jgi:hypothetical protein